MHVPSNPSTIDPDLVPRSVVGLAIDLTSLEETEPHRHRKAQLLYVMSGVITVEAAGVFGPYRLIAQSGYRAASLTPHARRAG